MKLRTLFTLAILAMGSSGCAAYVQGKSHLSNPPLDTPSRAEVLDPGVAPIEAAADPVAVTTENVHGYEIRDIRFVWPGDLKVAEGNGFYPFADVVWRGDPLGDRRAQIADIFTTAFRAAGEGVEGTTPVIVEITLRRFHSVTDRTRYTVGGMHSIMFELAVRDAETGALLEEPRFVDASFPALGGAAAVAAEARGEGQKVRVLAHLTNVARHELGLPGAF